MIFWSAIGLILVIIIFLFFVKRIGSTIPILEFLLLIAGLQWIIGPFIDYRTDFEHYKYYMYVDESTYMSYVVPAFIVFAITILAVTKHRVIQELNIYKLSQFSYFGLVLLAISFSIDALSTYLPGQPSFVTYLLSSMKYVGAIILYFSDKIWHRKLLYLAVILLGFNAISSGLFHEFILWSVFFYMFWAFQKKPSIRITLLIIVSGFLVSTAIQAVKSDFRASIYAGYSGNRVSLFMDILSSRFSGGFADNPAQTESLNVRLNQGWIISAVLDHTPRIQEFAEGETIKEAIIASAVPRFIYTDKKIAGGVENFIKYTGLNIGDNTSMGVSVIGEAYLNYGRFGGLLFMGFWGIFLGLFWSFLVNQISTSNILLFFLPIIFIQVVKAETELVVVLNHLVKSSVLVFLIILIFRPSLEKSE